MSSLSQATHTYFWAVTLLGSFCGALTAAGFVLQEGLEFTDQSLIQNVLDYTFKPNSRGRLLWDVFVLVLVFYSSVITPYETAFNPAHEILPASNEVGFNLTSSVPQPLSTTTSPECVDTNWDGFVDLCFWIDIVLTFWTGYDKGFEVIMDKRLIAKHYIMGWFGIDFVATVCPCRALYNKSPKNNLDAVESL